MQIISLPWPDNHYVRAASGWLELGNFSEAKVELKRVSPRVRAGAEVLSIRWHILAHDKK